MAKKIIKAQMKQRTDTKANWASSNPVLLKGELGFVSDDPNLYKVGDGTTAWNALPFRGFDGTLAQEPGISETSAISPMGVTKGLGEIKNKLGGSLILERGSISGGKPSDALQSIRLRSQKMEIVSDVHFETNEGFSFYYYIYNPDDSVAKINESLNQTLDLTGYVGKSILFVFRKTDNTQIQLFDDIVASMSGLYDANNTVLDQTLQQVKSLASGESTLKSNIGALIQLTRGGVGPTGEADFANPDYRLHTQKLDIVGDLYLATKYGYSFYYYIFDKDGAYLSKDEGLNQELSLTGMAGNKIRFVFRTTVDAAIDIDADIIESISGLYSNDVNLSSEILKLKGLISSNNTDNPEGGDVPVVGTYPVWEPESVPTDKSCPLGQGNQSIDYTYAQLLADYFDPYIWKKYDDGYKVSKEGIGNDSSKMGYELFCYEFAPKYYKNVVLISGGMNPCELSGLFGIGEFIKALMEHKDAGMAALYRSTKFVILPCICPSSLDARPIKYTNFNDVRINKNFNYETSWKTIGELYPTEKKGDYPDSESETVILKAWANKYKNATVWIDCHSDSGTSGKTYILAQAICSDSDTHIKISATMDEMEAFYREKGYIKDGDTPQKQSWVETGTNYPKTLYSYKICNTPAVMIEQYISSKMYGSDGATNNDSYGIKNYVTILRSYILAMCKG